MTGRDDDLFTGWRAPSAPSGLEQRVLQAAKDPDHRPIPRRIEDRIWNSRGLRTVWLAAASLLLAANLLVSDPGEPVVAEREPAAAPPAAEGLDIGIPIPPHRSDVTTLGDAHELVIALLEDPCLEPSYEGDCT
jgi:hypothetical protein